MHALEQALNYCWKSLLVNSQILSSIRGEKLIMLQTNKTKYNISFPPRIHILIKQIMTMIALISPSWFSRLKIAGKNSPASACQKFESWLMNFCRRFAFKILKANCWLKFAMLLLAKF